MGRNEEEINGQKGKLNIQWFSIKKKKKKMLFSTKWKKKESP